MGAHRSTLAALVTLVVLSLAGCEWKGAYYDAGLSSFNSTEATVTPSTVGALVKRFHLDIGTGEPTNAVVMSGTLLVGTTDGRIVAGDSHGGTGCAGTPVMCSPLWTAQPFAGDVAVRVTSFSVPGGLRVFAAPEARSTPGTSVKVYDTNGAVNCGGAPKVCLPVWQTSAVPAGEPNVGGTSVFVVDAVTGRLQVFDGAGSTNCAGSPKVCSPLWSAPSAPGTPAMSDAAVFVGAPSGDHTLVYDIAGATNCSGAPKVCSPIWTTSIDAGISTRPIVAAGRLYSQEAQVVSGGPATDTGDVLRVFDAAGTTGCSGTPKVCSPVAVATIPPHGSFAVAGGVVYGIGSLFDGTATLATHAYATKPGCVSSCPTWDIVGADRLAPDQPITAAGLAYVTRAYTNGSQPVVALEARSTADGALKWSVFGDAADPGGYVPAGAIVGDGQVFVTVRSTDPTVPRPERGIDAYA